MTETPREYDREYVTRTDRTVRRRLGYAHERGVVTRFVVQLEYYHGNEWHPVVRYDHDPESHHGHDVTDEGLHIDIFRDHEKLRSEYITPPLQASIALDFAEDHLTENAQRFINRYETWHGIDNR